MYEERYVERFQGYMKDVNGFEERERYERERERGGYEQRGRAGRYEEREPERELPPPPPQQAPPPPAGAAGGALGGFTSING